MVCKSEENIQTEKYRKKMKYWIYSKKVIILKNKRSMTLKTILFDILLDYIANKIRQKKRELRKSYETVNFTYDIRTYKENTSY